MEFCFCSDLIFLRKMEVGDLFFSVVSVSVVWVWWNIFCDENVFLPLVEVRIVENGFIQVGSKFNFCSKCRKCFHFVKWKLWEWWGKAENLWPSEYFFHVPWNVLNLNVPQGLPFDSQGCWVIIGIRLGFAPQSLVFDSSSLIYMGLVCVGRAYAPWTCQVNTTWISWSAKNKKGVPIFMFP